MDLSSGGGDVTPSSPIAWLFTGISNARMCNLVTDEPEIGFFSGELECYSGEPYTPPNKASNDPSCTEFRLKCKYYRKKECPTVNIE